MTQGHSNVQLMRRCYEALGAGDVRALKDSASPHFSFEVSGNSAISGTAHSVEEAAAEFERSMALTGGTMAMTPQSLMADGAVGIGIFGVTASRPDGRSIQQRILHEWAFESGRVTSIREWIWDQAADAQFWS